MNLFSIRQCGSVALTLGLTLLNGDSLAAERALEPAAPTISDAHQFIGSVASRNEMTALYTAHVNGEVIGYMKFPVRAYIGSVCQSALTLGNGDRIDIDWAFNSKLQASEGQIGIWQSPYVEYDTFYLIVIEGGVTTASANKIPKFTVAISNELSRNRSLKAMALLSSSCRSTSKFD